MASEEHLIIWHLKSYLELILFVLRVTFGPQALCSLPSVVELCLLVEQIKLN